jgi:signal transduction histidine kinase
VRFRWESSALKFVWAALPRGYSLPPDVWDHRHRVILGLLWLQALGLVVFGRLSGDTLGHSALHGVGVAVFALIGSIGSFNRHVRSSFASVGLVSASATLVHISGGYIEMHFHFFVMVGVLAFYQSWTPFLVAIVFVVIHHGVVGWLAPADVYNHPSAWAHPWTWALIHGVFVLGMSAVSVTAWRLNEIAQSRLRITNGELERQAQELQRKNTELDQFISSIYHDFRTPLVAAHGIAGTLLDSYGDTLDERGRHFLERMQANVTLMESLTVNLRTLSQVGRGTIPGEPVEFSDIVRDVVAELAEPIEARGVEVVVRGAGTFWGVRRDLRRVFANLLTNAVQYLGSAPAPAVEIGSIVREGILECYVRDNGIGIDPAYHARVFETFQRLQDVPGIGAGLGLTIVKKIVESAGGRVWIDSARMQGATFWFTWPTAPAREG